MGKLEGKVGVITGGCSGIGLATAKKFVAEGAKVVIGDLDEENGPRIADELGGVFVKVNVTDQAEVENLFKVAHDTYGRIDIAFNNAGISPASDDSILKTGIDAWNLVQDVNLTSVYYCCKAVLPYMLGQGSGSIINTASFVAIMGAATSQISYTASKGGVLAMTRELGVQFARKGIRVNALCPGRSTPPCCRSCSPRTPSAPLAGSCTCRWAASPSRRRSRTPCPSSAATSRASSRRWTSSSTADSRTPT